jgi:hypothetical protein
VKFLIVFTRISFIVTWVVLKAIDIYTEKPDGSIKSIGMATAGRMRKTEQNPEVTANALTRYVEKNQAMPGIYSGFEVDRNPARCIVIHGTILEARQSHGTTDTYFDGRNPELRIGGTALPWG